MIIEQCIKDLEKLLGFEVAITIRSEGHGENVPTRRDLYVPLPTIQSTFDDSESEYFTFFRNVKYFSVRKPEELDGDRDIAKFALQEMPACNGILLSIFSYTNYDYRNIGVGRRLNQFRIDYARSLGYSVLMCTHAANNNIQTNLLEKNGWQDIFSFMNRSTGNKVDLSVVIL